jgi:hypothetical protein
MLVKKEGKEGEFEGGLGLQQAYKRARSCSPGIPQLILCFPDFQPFTNQTRQNL